MERFGARRNAGTLVPSLTTRLLLQLSLPCRHLPSFVTADAQPGIAEAQRKVCLSSCRKELIGSRGGLTLLLLEPAAHSGWQSADEHATAGRLQGINFKQCFALLHQLLVNSHLVVLVGSSGGAGSAQPRARSLSTNARAEEVNPRHDMVAVFTCGKCGELCSGCHNKPVLYTCELIQRALLLMQARAPPSSSAVKRTTLA